MEFSRMEEQAVKTDEDVEISSYSISDYLSFSTYVQKRALNKLPIPTQA